MKKVVKLYEIAFKNLMVNSRRTILSVATVALSVILLVNILTYFDSNDERIKNAAVSEIGPYHVQYNNINNTQLEKLQENELINECYVSHLVDYSKHNLSIKMFEDYGVTMAILWSDSIGTTNSLFKLNCGRAPANENEIVLDEWLVEKLGFEVGIGEIITTEIVVKDSSSNIIERIPINLIIVGIQEDIASRKIANAGIMLVSDSFIEKYSPNYQVTANILLKSNYNASDVSYEIANNIALRNQDQVKLNNAYIDAYEIDINSISTIIFLLLLIFLVSSVVIYNIFQIYLFQNVKYFGMLSSIGASKRKLCTIIIIEGITIGLIGSALGVILGVTISHYSIPLIGSITNTDIIIETKISFVTILLSFISGFLIVLLSIVSPVRHISSNSIMNAIRYAPANMLKKKITRKITLMNLVITNFFRHKKRTIIMILSITLTGIIFLVASSVLKSMDIEKMTSSMVQGDYMLSYTQLNEENDLLTNDIMLNIADTEGISKVFTEMADGLILNEDSITKYTISQDLNLSNKVIGIDMLGYNDELLKIALENCGQEIDLNDMKKNNYVIVFNNEYFNYQVGDIVITRKYTDQKNVELEVVGVVDDYITYNGISSTGGLFMCHQNLFYSNSLDTRLKKLSASVLENHAANVEDKFESIAESNEGIELSVFSDYFDDLTKSKKMIEMLVYAVVLLLSITSVFNLANTTFTNIFSRDKEFSTLEAIGMTRGQLLSQLLLEGYAIVTISLIIIFALGIPCGYYAVRLFKVNATYASYSFPVVQITLFVISLFITQTIIILLSNSLLHNQTLMKRISQ